MSINKKTIELATCIKNTEEFRKMNENKANLDKNKTIKKKLDNYLLKKKNIYSNFSLEEASKKISILNEEYKDFFHTPIISEYIKSTKNFNDLMENIYKTIEKELIK